MLAFVVTSHGKGDPWFCQQCREQTIIPRVYAKAKGRGVLILPFKGPWGSPCATGTPWERSCRGGSLVLPSPSAFMGLEPYATAQDHCHSLRLPFVIARFDALHITHFA